MSGLYSVYDYKAGSYCPPFVAESDVEAERQVVSLMFQAKEIPPVLYPNDFALMKLAVWSNTEGVSLLSEKENYSLGTLFEISVKYKKVLEQSQDLMRRLFEEKEDKDGK